MLFIVRRRTQRKDYQFVGMYHVENERLLNKVLRDAEVDPRFCERLSLNALNMYAIKLVGNVRKNGKHFVSNTIFDDQITSLIKDGNWEPILNPAELGDAV